MQQRSWSMLRCAQKQKQPQKQIASSLSRASTPIRLNDRADMMRHLQQAIGNRAVLRLLQSQAENLKTKSGAGAARILGYDSSQAPIASLAGTGLQTKLAINKPGDQYEREA